MSVRSSRELRALGGASSPEYRSLVPAIILKELSVAQICGPLSLFHRCFIKLKRGTSFMG